MITYKHVAFALLDTGLLTPDRVRAVLDRSADHLDEHLDPHAVALALEDFGVAVSVPVDDVGDLKGAYADLLAQAAALTGGAVTVSDVVLHEGEFPSDGVRDDVLEFAVNGRTVTVDAEHRSDRHVDHLAATDAVDALAPGDSRAFHYVDSGGPGTVLVLATPEQARTLEDHLGLKLH
ncbi:hypothetical protein [Saccharothrix variisporea]|uniref:Uncharacterized protein n=1 Tax=Saccharothrix variisporea TaxID=543527 RepID=A0A495XD01_9PSEU|nr:hypothetical protein [Saccharothrix variisporea]RKT70493.1 hypothetical protein DFJ66_3762 [Saccharothrix variisporea]